MTGYYMVDSSHLSKYSLFGGLLMEQIEGIFPQMKHETYTAGENNIAAGDLNDRIRFIISGRVEVSKNGLVLAEFKAGDTFGEMEVLDMLPAAATVRALSPVEATSLSNATLHDVYKRDIKAFSLIVMNLARDLARRMHRLDELATANRGPAPQRSELFIS
jgi:CRP-like cAMP-binding protein